MFDAKQLHINIIPECSVFNYLLLTEICNVQFFPPYLHHVSDEAGEIGEKDINGDMSLFCFFFFSIIVKWNKRYLSHNVSVSVAGGQVQRRVVSSVHDVDARPSHDEHVHHVGAALPAGPVERAEAVVITAKRQTIEIKH